jgi:hypothetical protein
MNKAKGYSTFYLLGRSLLPSAISGMLCFCFSIFLVGIHLLLLSLQVGTSLPTLLDGQWGLAYTNTVVQPITALFSNFTFNNVLIVGLWGLAGLMLYFLVEYVVYVRRDWQHAEHDIQLADNGRIIKHPARASFLKTVLWRMGVLILAATLFVVSQHIVQRLLMSGSEIVAGSLGFRAASLELAIEVLGWTLVAHGFVSFLRLFAMRTRLFGDPEIE